MPFYHVTFARHLASIRRYGLGARLVERNWPDAEPGVYLADDPVWGVMILVDLALAHAPDDLSPQDYLASLRILVIDDARIDAARLEPDPSFPDKTCIRLYKGVLDIAAMPVLTLDDVLPSDARMPPIRS